jgi:YVTN family beta-propeller protein
VRASTLLLSLSLSMLLALPLAASTARICITNNAGDTVQVIDPATNQVAQEIRGIEVHTGLRVYVTYGSENAPDVVDQETGNIIKKVPLSGHLNSVAHPGRKSGFGRSRRRPAIWISSTRLFLKD